MRLLKAFTAYYKQLKLDKEIEQLKAEGQAKYDAKQLTKTWDLLSAYKKLPLPTEPLTQGVTPTATQLTTETVQFKPKSAKKHPNGQPKSKPYNHRKFI